MNVKKCTNISIVEVLEKITLKIVVTRCVRALVKSLTCSGGSELDGQTSAQIDAQIDAHIERDDCSIRKYDTEGQACNSQSNVGSMPRGSSVAVQLVDAASTDVEFDHSESSRFEHGSFLRPLDRPHSPAQLAGQMSFTLSLALPGYCWPKAEKAKRAG